MKGASVKTMDKVDDVKEQLHDAHAGDKELRPDPHRKYEPGEPRVKTAGVASWSGRV